LALLLLALWGFISWQWSFTHVMRPEVTTGAALPFGITALFAIVVACVPMSKHYIVAALVIGLIWNSLLTFLQVANQGSIGLKVLGEFTVSLTSGASVVQADGMRWIRPYGLLPHPNMLAGFLAIGLLAASAWVLSKRPLLWWLGTMIALFGFFALLMTFSRAAWGALILGGLVILFLLWRKRLPIHLLESLLTLGLILVVTFIFVLLFRPFLLARAGINTESIELRSISDRAVFNEFALRAIGESPVLGVGIGNFPWVASMYLMSTDYELRGENVHNIYLSAWAELGIVGLALTLLALALGAWAVIKNLSLPTSNESERIARMALFSGFVALAAIGTLDHYPWTAIQFQAALWGLLAAASTSS
jgi:O-antigen ligase